MTKFDWFSLITGIIGLVVDVVAILGIVLGLVTPPSVGFVARPIVVLIITFSILVYTLTIIMVFLARESAKRTDPSKAEGLAIISYFLWVPSILLWGLAMLRIHKIPEGVFDQPEPSLLQAWLVLLATGYTVLVLGGGGFIWAFGLSIYAAFSNREGEQIAGQSDESLQS